MRRRTLIAINLNEHSYSQFDLNFFSLNFALELIALASCSSLAAIINPLDII